MSVLGGEERVRRSGVALPARTPDPVDVVLTLTGVIVVDDELDVVHVCRLGGKRKWNKYDVLVV